MNVAELEKMHALEEEYWWFVGRRAIIESVLEKHIGRGAERWVLDLASATGGNLQMLGEWGKVAALDLSPRALEHCRERGCRRVLCASATAMPLASESIDLVACLDLLEHLEDDALGMREMFRVTKRGGTVVITVPSYMWLWSDHDVALDHRRRYRLPQVVSLLEQAGFEVLQGTYCIFFLLPPIAVFRVMQRALRRFVGSPTPATAYIQPPRWMSAIFVWLLRLEARLLKRMNLPFGVSCLCVARRPG